MEKEGLLILKLVLILSLYHIGIFHCLCKKRIFCLPYPIACRKKGTHVNLRYGYWILVDWALDPHSFLFVCLFACPPILGMTKSADIALGMGRKSDYYDTVIMSILIWIIMKILISGLMTIIMKFMKKEGWTVWWELGWETEWKLDGVAPLMADHPPTSS